MANNIQHIMEDLKALKKNLEANFVSKSEFEPVRKIVYGLVGLLLTMVAGAVFALVLRA